MVRIGIVGGALQGMELAYLARKAGFKTVLIDRRPFAPALSLCDEPIVMDPVLDPLGANQALSGCDAIIPGCENPVLLKALKAIVQKLNVPFLFDMNAYETSSSKLKSNEVMTEACIPIPKEWPECGFPTVVKPSFGSGSEGVRVVNNQQELQEGLENIKRMNQQPVIQGFVSGKSISMEVIGDGSSVVPYVTTEIILDEVYDCKRVLCAPSLVSESVEEQFQSISRRLGEVIGLKGLMDVEAIVSRDIPYILELDARFPSQTPAAVLHSTGINLLQELYESKVKGTSIKNANPRWTIYEHLIVNGETMASCGEKKFASIIEPSIFSGWFGCDEVITNYELGKENWLATIMISGRNQEELESKRNNSIKRIMAENGIEHYSDPTPKVI